MISVDEAIHKILQNTSSLKTSETVPLSRALGRTLNETVISNVNVPPNDNSAMDGYAVNTDDLTPSPVTLNISQVIAAGAATQPLQPGTAARIFTGAELPMNSNAVVMQENCVASPDQEQVTILQSVVTGENVRPQGQDIGKNDCIMSAGKILSPQDIGLLAAVGKSKIKVAKKVRVTVVSTGDELVTADDETQLETGKIFNSNAPMLHALLQKANCEIISNIHIPDDLARTEETLLKASADSDLIVSCGGVSVGDKDYVKAALDKVGELNLWKVKLKPGKPIAIGRIGNTQFLGLPGNPVSSFVTFLLFALPIIRKMQGSQYTQPISIPLASTFSINQPTSRPEYLRVRIINDAVERYPNQSSGVLRSLGWADALAYIPEGKHIAKGDMLRVFPLGLFFNE